MYVHETYGSGNWRRLKCKTCKLTFSERRGTVFFRMRIPEETAIKIVTQVSRGGSVRGTAETAGVDQNAVMRVVKVAGEHAQTVHEYMVRDLKVGQVQADEVFTYVKNGSFRVRDGSLGPFQP
jgi:LacI family transcriptional regulator